MFWLHVKNAQKSMFFCHSATSPYPTAKPSWGWLRVGIRKPRLVLVGIRATCDEVTAKARAGVLGCSPPPQPQPAAARRSPPQPAWRSAQSRISFSVNGGVLYSARRKQPALTRRRAMRFNKYYATMHCLLYVMSDPNLSHVRHHLWQSASRRCSGRGWCQQTPMYGRGGDMGDRFVALTLVKRPAQGRSGTP